MTDAISATGAALYTALAAAITDVPVFQHVPAETPAPMVIIGDIDNASPIGAAGDPDKRVPVTIVIITEGEERRPCALLVAEVERALDGRTLTSVPGWSITPYLDRSSATLAEDGLTYVGLVQLTALALTD